MSKTCLRHGPRSRGDKSLGDDSIWFPRTLAHIQAGPWAHGEAAVPGKSHNRAGAPRRRRPSKGLIHIEVRAARRDTALIRAVAETLRGEPERARALRSTLEEALVGPEVKTAFDVFGSDLPEETFADVFDHPRPASWREVEL
jgi:hypothetical protein